MRQITVAVYRNERWKLKFSQLIRSANLPIVTNKCKLETFCFLRGPHRWLSAAKDATVDLAEIQGNTATYKYSVASFEFNVIPQYVNIIISFRFYLSVSLVTSHTACWPVMQRMTQSLVSSALSRRSQILSRLEMHHWIYLTSICCPSEFLIALVSSQGGDWIGHKLWQTVKFNTHLSNSHFA